HALLRLLPALPQQADLVVAAGQRREPRRINAAASFADFPHLEEFDGLCHSLDLLAAEADAVEPALQQSVGGFAANDRAGDGDLRQPHGDVPRLSHQRDRPLGRLDDGRPGVNADPQVQLELVFAAKPLAEGFQVLEEAEARLCGPARAVLVSNRVAEADQQALLVTLHDRPAQPARGLIAGLLEAPQHPGLVLGVEALQVRLGVEQVTAPDKAGALAAVGLAGAAPGRGRRYGLWWWGLGRRASARLTHCGRNWQRPGILHLGSHREDPAQVGGEVRGGGVAILLPLRQRLEA